MAGNETVDRLAKRAGDDATFATDDDAVQSMAMRVYSDARARSEAHASQPRTPANPPALRPAPSAPFNPPVVAHSLGVG